MKNSADACACAVARMSAANAGRQPPDFAALIRATLDCAVLEVTTGMTQKRSCLKIEYEKQRGRLRMRRSPHERSECGTTAPGFRCAHPGYIRLRGLRGNNRNDSEEKLFENRI